MHASVAVQPTGSARVGKLALTTLLSIGLVSPVARADTIRVPADHATIQAAIDAAVDGDEVLVSPGTYVEVIDFLGKAIWVRSTDGPEATVISGKDLDYSVVTFVSGEGPETGIEGFTIRDGTGTLVLDRVGGGVRILDSSPTILRCHIVRNEAVAGGGMSVGRSRARISECVFRFNAADQGAGMYNSVSSPTVTDCEFRSNSAYLESMDEGGGMLNVRSNTTVSNCTFIHNTADWGAGIHNYRCDRVVVSLCSFIENEAWEDGGGAMDGESTTLYQDCIFTANTAHVGGAIRTGGDSSTTFSGCVFSENSPSAGGGVVFITSGSLSMANCTATRNTSTGGNTILTWLIPSTISVTNSILWNGGDEIYNSNESQITVTYSDVEGGYAGEGNINVDPLFLDPENGDYHLRPRSPCSDAGDNTAVPPDTEDMDGDGDRAEPIPFDIDGSPRFADNPCADDTGRCEPCERPIVDMGADEVPADVGCCVRQPEWQCDGDVDGDGQVNPVDSGLIQAAFGSTDEQDVCNYDLDCDGQINPVDAGLVQALFGTCEPPRTTCR